MSRDEVDVSEMADQPGSSHEELEELELRIKLKELQVKEKELDALHGKAGAWIRHLPIMAGLIGAILGLFANMVVSYINGVNAVALERERLHSNIEMRRAEARIKMIVESIKTGDRETARRNLQFLLDADLLEDADGRVARILQSIEKMPVLPPAPSDAQSIGSAPAADH